MVKEISPSNLISHTSLIFVNGYSVVAIWVPSLLVPWSSRTQKEECPSTAQNGRRFHLPHGNFHSRDWANRNILLRKEPARSPSDQFHWTIHHPLRLLCLLFLYPLTFICSYPTSILVLYYTYYMLNKKTIGGEQTS
ncbi:hypothetical protein ES708_09298 [subsurface metagenome]